VGLTKEEKEQLELLTRKANEPDEDDKYEIEIGSGDKYARIPYHKGRSYLQEHFGIDLDPGSGEESGEGSTEEGEGGKSKKQAKSAGTNEGSQRTGHWSGRIDRNSNSA
jgi:hypothetical protein